ncbi:MAG: class A beta-lactamase-related serine hydrolase, partial [Actinobacteria bacterium]|nr:class A beta-lactamase-related serine hydrolase [Actinomycetota bacterium]
MTYLNEPSVRDRALTSSDRALLEPMIRWSDNVTATRTLHIVGAAAVAATAERAGMTRFRLVWSPWGHSEITARDQARFFHSIDRQVPARHRAYALRLLAAVVPSQRWGVARASPRGWNLYFKGGWGSGRGLVDHQVALLEAGGERVAAAVLTRNNPSHAYGNETLRGVFARLFAGLPRPRPLGAGRAVAFAYDHGRVAWVPRGCERVDVRSLATGLARAFAMSGTCATVDRPIGLAAGRAYWTRREAGATRLLTAALRDPVVRS